MDDFYERIFDVVFKYRLSEMAVTAFSFSEKTVRSKDYDSIKSELRKVIDSNSKLEVNVIGIPAGLKFYRWIWKESCSLPNAMSRMPAEHLKAKIEANAIKKAGLDKWVFTNNGFTHTAVLDVDFSDEDVKFVRRDIGKAVVEFVDSLVRNRDKAIFGCGERKFLEVSSVDELKVAADLLVV